MPARFFQTMLPLIALAWAAPAWAQITVLDQAQDAVGVPTPREPIAVPPPICGTQPITIAEMA